MTPKKVNFVSFPPVNSADKDGLLAMGGDLSVDTLLSAYQQGIFPWFCENQPILWWSPDPRLVLYPREIKISRSLRKKILQHRFNVTCNTSFNAVIQNCASRGQPPNNRPHNDQQQLDQTWITRSMSLAYQELHQQGYAHSIEVWHDKQLVGGLYGIALGNVFFGESMFSSVSDASKVALATLCCWLRLNDYQLIDCQVSSSHLISLGAKEIARSKFLKSLATINIEQPSKNFGQDISHLTVESVINTE